MTSPAVSSDHHALLAHSKQATYHAKQAPFSQHNAAYARPALFNEKGISDRMLSSCVPGSVRRTHRSCSCCCRVSRRVLSPSTSAFWGAPSVSTTTTGPDCFQWAAAVIRCADPGVRFLGNRQCFGIARGWWLRQLVLIGAWLRGEGRDQGALRATVSCSPQLSPQLIQLPHQCHVLLKQQVRWHRWPWQTMSANSLTRRWQKPPSPHISVSSSS